LISSNGTVVFHNGEHVDASVSGSGKTMMEYFGFFGNAGALMLSDLTPNSTNEISLYSYGWEGGGRVVNFSSTSGGKTESVDQDIYGVGIGIIVRLTYVADGNGEATIVLSPSQAAGWHLAGFYSEEIAAPSAQINVADKIVLDIDKQRVQQLFINAIQNAINAGKQNVNIRISATTCNPSLSLIPDTAQVAGNLECINNYKGELVEVIIADDGPGIDADILSKIFDPFFTTSEPGYGAGLGLYIVQEVMAEHSGCLAIVSDKNSGTKVILLFPVGIHK